uniref:Testis expressed gene 21 n=1 Tax=Jaculus jaculus TaxID=51337 RepID=A0A8C5K1V9_JACJA
MASRLQSLNHSDPGRLANGPNTGPRKAKPSEARHLSHLSPWKNCPVACFGPPDVVPTRNPISYNQKAADLVHPDLAGLLMKTKTSAQLRNLQSKLLLKETSLQDMKNELESYKESNVRQSLQIMSLRNDIKDLQDLTASLVRTKTLKNTSGQSRGRGNWDLTARVIEIENHLRVHLVEREKTEQKAVLSEEKLSCPSRIPPHVNLRGREDSLDMFPVKDEGEAILANNLEREKTFYSEGLNDGQQIWDDYLQDLIHQENQASELDGPPDEGSRGPTAEQSQHQNFLSHLATLLSDSIGPIPATEDAVEERIQEIGTSERSWKLRTEGLQQEIEKLTKRLEQLHRLHEEARESLQPEENCRDQKRPLKHPEEDIAINDFSPGRLDSGRNKENFRTQNSQVDKHKKSKQLETLLNAQQNLKTPRMEEKIQKLQKQLSDLKLSNKNMKTQLTRINVLKDKTIEKLRQSLVKVEMMKEKAVPQTDNLKTTLDSGEQEETSDKVRASQMPAGVTPEHPTMNSTPKGVLGQEQEPADFRDTIMKMLGFHMKTADKEIINQLKLVIQVYEIASKCKLSSGGETQQET